MPSDSNKMYFTHAQIVEALKAHHPERWPKTSFQAGSRWLKVGDSDVFEVEILKEFS